jgi:hypothetical protein
MSVSSLGSHSQQEKTLRKGTNATNGSAGRALSSSLVGCIWDYCPTNATAHFHFPSPMSLRPSLPAKRFPSYQLLVIPGFQVGPQSRQTKTHRWAPRHTAPAFRSVSEAGRPGTRSATQEASQQASFPDGWPSPAFRFAGSAT